MIFDDFIGVFVMIVVAVILFLILQLNGFEYAVLSGFAWIAGECARMISVLDG